MSKILITPRSLTRHGLDRVPELQSLRERFELVGGPAGMTPSAEQLAMLVPGCVGWLAGVDVPWSSAALVRGEWCRFEGRELADCTVGVVDLGASADGAPPYSAGHIGSYAVDAFDCEPPRISELLRHPRVIATPHLGAFTTASVRKRHSDGRR